MLTLNIPINPTSLGACGYHLARAIQEDANIYVIGGGADLASFEPVSSDVKQRIVDGIGRCHKEHKFEGASLKLWHPFQGFERITPKQAFYTFHELDSLTPLEVNHLNSQDAILVPCKFNEATFRNCGVTQPIHVVPLGVDTDVFRPMAKYAKKTGPYTFLMAGQFEARKCHMEILQAFGGLLQAGLDVKLRCCISNRFVNMQSVYQAIGNIFGGQIPPQIEFVDWLPTEAHFADFLNSGDALVGVSRGESWNLVLLQAMACGIRTITNFDHAHADFANEANSIQVQSEGKEVAQDNVFFRNDGNINTGLWSVVKPQAIHEAMKVAVQQGRKKNEKGIEVASKYTWESFAEKCVEVTKSLNV